MIDVSAILSMSSGTSAEWENVRIPEGTFVLATDTQIIKVGNGVDLWKDLPAALDIIQLNNALEYFSKLPTIDPNSADKVLTISSEGTSIVAQEDLLPIGTSILWNTEIPPNRYLEEDGSWLSKITYAKLFGVIGGRFGETSTHFRLADKRGLLMRIWAHGSNTDPDRNSRIARADGVAGDNVGTIQNDQVGPHGHYFFTSSGPNQASYQRPNFFTWGNTNRVSESLVINNGTTETRPKNINVMSCIKY